MQNVVRGTVSLCAVIWWNEATRLNRKNTRPLPNEARTWSTREMGSWLRLLILWNFLLLTVIRAPRDFVGKTTSRLEYGEVECWITPAARRWLKVASTSLAKIRLIVWGQEVTGAVPSGTEISKGIREQEPNSVLDLDQNVSKSAKNTTQRFDCERGPAWAVKVESNRAQM